MNKWDVYNVGMSKVNHKDSYGNIQWKGTDVCIDIYCECGEHSHFDGYFMSFIKCGICGSTYRVDTAIELFKLTDEQVGLLDGFFQTSEV